MNKRKYFFIILLLSIIVSIMICIIFVKYGNDNSKENTYEIEKPNTHEEDNEDTNKQKNLNNSATIQEEIVKEYPKEEVMNMYKGYEVCAKLEIPSISLEANVLSSYSKKALNVSATKFWGVEPNREGNFCVAGHNRKNMFYDIKKLKIGDTLFVIDNEIGKVEYEIFKIYKVIPEDVSCLDAVTNNGKEVTLITCTSDVKKRIIIKAKEKVM